MEFNGIVNKFLRKDPESRKRSLNIRTYVSSVNYRGHFRRKITPDLQLTYCKKGRGLGLMIKIMILG